MNTRAYKLFSRFCDLLAYTETRVPDPDQAIKVLRPCMRDVMEAKSAPEDENLLFSWCCTLIDAHAATVSSSTNGTIASLTLDQEKS